MSYTTTVVPGFAWSYSHLKNFETCPKRYYHYQVRKDIVEPESDQLREGNKLHKVFENRLKGEALPFGFGHYESILARIAAAPGQTLGEQKLALTAEFKPVAFFGKGVWFRTVIDAGKLQATRATIFDWKTGKPAEDLTQLQLMSATLFHHNPTLQRVSAALVFVNHEHVEPAHFTRESLPEIWNEVLPRVRRLQAARQSMEFPPTPSGLCKRYCAVTSCPHHGG